MNKIIYASVLALTSAFVACSTEDGYTELERTEAYFADKLGGEISPAQWWKTSVTLNVTVRASTPVKLWVLSDEWGGTLYDYRETTSAGIVSLSVPQGKGTTLYLVSLCDRVLKSQAIKLSGKNEENIVLANNGKGTAKAPSQAVECETLFHAPMTIADSDEPDPVAFSLYGNSVNRNGELLQLTKEQVTEFYNMMDLLSRESQNAKSMGFNVDYELESNGPFHITWIAGNCRSTTSHILGYYYHTPGTYNDIKYVDLCETEIFDVIDGYAKVQYQINQSAVDMYPADNLQLGKWYAANFDMNDIWGGTAGLVARNGDNAWNSMGVYARYGKDVIALRGLSFLIDVPAGKRIGFYDRWETQPRSDQYDKFEKLGIQPYTDRDNFNGTSYSAEGLNTYNAKGNFRSLIYPMEKMMWLGMENDITGGDLDCNDVIFGISADLNIYVPSVVEPDLMPYAEYESQMPWTIAYEDVKRNADFDFNDAVILLTPDYEKELCCVQVRAAGSTSRMYLHYDGPTGDVNLGEVHELLLGDPSKEINTKSSVAQTNFVTVGCVPWPKDYTMMEDANRFWIEVQRGTCEDCTDMITLSYRPGEVPEALLIAGEWNWPMEGTHIFSAYTNFPNWAKDVTKTGFWNWYQSPKTNAIVLF